MRAKKRTEDQIIFEILKICEGDGVIITKIVGSLNLNFKTTPKYINLLVKNELIEVVNGEAILYKTTPKGIKALRYFRKLNALIPK